MINPVNKPADFNRAAPTEQKSSTQVNQQQKKETAESVEQPKDELQLSDAFREIEKLRQVIDNTTEIDQSRVERLKNLIDSGDYEINSDVIANRLLDE